MSDTEDQTPDADAPDEAQDAPEVANADQADPDTQADADGGSDEAEEAEPVAPRRRLGPADGTAAPYGLMAKRAARRLGLTEPEFDAIETIPGTEGEEPVNIEGTPLEDGQEVTPAVVLGPDGQPMPTSDDGIPVLTDESGVPAPADEPAPEDDEPSDGPEPEPADEGYDPGAHTVAEVQAYLSENPDQTTYVLDRERAGKARVTLLGA